MELMKTLEFTATNHAKVSIPVKKITGFTEVIEKPAYGNCFIATGSDDADGGENGWYVIDSYEDVKAKYHDSVYS